MSKTTRGQVREGRGRQLNVIYFVDSSRTKSFTVSLAALNVALFLALALVTWSVASAGILAWMATNQLDLKARLRGALATVFEYEMRYDDVFGVAYPPEAPLRDQPPPSVATLYAGAPAARDSKHQESASFSEPTAPGTTAAPEERGGEDAAPPKSEAPPAAADSAGSLVVVGNPVLEKSQDSLLLHFDLTSKGTSDRAEGYLWAVAEFVADDGEKMFIAAPREIGVTATGEPLTPERSAIFNIRRYKKKSFSFPYVKDRSGTFTGVRIGVMDRTKGHRTTYNVPVEIRIGVTDPASKNPNDQDDAAKSG